MSLYTRHDGGARSISMRELASLPFDNLVTAVAPTAPVTEPAAAPYARRAREPSPAPHMRRPSSSGLGPGAPRRPLPGAAAAPVAPDDRHTYTAIHTPQPHHPNHQDGGGRTSPRRRRPASSLDALAGHEGGGGGRRAPTFGGRFGGARSSGGGMGAGSASGGSILDGLQLPPLNGVRGQLGPGLGRSMSSPIRTRGRAAAAPSTGAETAAAAASGSRGLLAQHMRRAGSLLSLLAGADPLQQLVAEMEAAVTVAGGPGIDVGPGSGLGRLLGPGVLLRRAVSAGRQRPGSHSGGGSGRAGGFSTGPHHAAQPSRRPRVVEVDEDGWEVPPPELLWQQAPGAVDRDRDEMGAGGWRPQQQRSASAGRHPALGRRPSGSGSGAGADDGWPLGAGGMGGGGVGGFFPVPLAPLGLLGDMLGDSSGLGLGLGLGLGAVLLPHGLAAGGGGSGSMGSMRPGSAASSGGEGYEALVALDEGRVKRVVRPEVVRALPTRTARRTDASQQCGVCLERYREGGSAITTLPCGHAFCSGCVEPWLGGQSATCPTCRWAFPQDQTHLLMEPQ
ncbi:hypothetical protein HXX76_008038 [Chlamydomonas incerta]|uniref:RING-type domain-containing protein n=1 Tax=Chlamydomonas incerta TaxID=51695 RepID=A0A835SY91_CHLIN|nr:hypothetical protein HXX76_008038 [Chlamydomonas incerta]|eukprot:KAG2433667.1 hypothetical protein HXX76_008038 [Chlamydomonas incerta]